MLGLCIGLRNTITQISAWMTTNLLPKPIQNRIPHYWTPRAIKQITYTLPAYFRQTSLLLHLTLLQFAISESSLIKTLPCRPHHQAISNLIHAYSRPPSIN